MTGVFSAHAGLLLGYFWYLYVRKYPLENRRKGEEKMWETEN
jgi:hypothetical protein